MILKKAIEVLKIESDGILGLIDKIDRNFIEGVSLILKSRGKIIFSGIGKSGIIGKKISSTFNSIGVKSIFLHPVEALHGDLGAVSSLDVFIAVSYSGETDELNILLPKIKGIGCKIISMTGNTNSILANYSSVVIDISVTKEACPFGLVPTTSTTALLAMGDALAVVLIDKKNIKSDDFKKNHPGGFIGRRLSMMVEDIMLTGVSLPIVYVYCVMKDALAIMDKYSFGAVLVSDKKNFLHGIITDGDLRRLIVKGDSIYDLSVRKVMTKKPYTLDPKFPLYDALNIMEERQITVLPIVDKNRIIKGIVHLHDILGKGAFRFENFSNHNKVPSNN